MTVFIVIERDSYEGDTFKGVFRTLEAAKRSTYLREDLWEEYGSDEWMLSAAKLYERDRTSVTLGCDRIIIREMEVLG